MVKASYRSSRRFIADPISGAQEFSEFTTSLSCGLKNLSSGTICALSLALYRVDNIPADNNPKSWTRAQVKDWFTKVCKDLDIEEEKVSQLTSMGGKGLNMLQKEDWLSHFPGPVGSLLFRLWKEEQPNEQSSGTVTKETKPGVYN